MGRYAVLGQTCPDSTCCRLFFGVKELTELAIDAQNFQGW
jgi:hypothetical protein